MTELDHQSLELAALNAALSAKQRGDTQAARKLMQRLSELHAQRPVELVRRMEKDRGLA